MQTTGQKITNFVKNVKIVEFHDHIWNQYEKCIQISTNMPSIGLVIMLYALTIWDVIIEICFKKTNMADIRLIPLDHVTNVFKIFKIFKIYELHDHIWNQY